MKAHTMAMATVLVLTGLSLASCANCQKPNENMETKRGKVIGIGGVFFKSQDPEKAKQWYEDHLGIENGPYGHVFTWYHNKDGEVEGQTVWTPFESDTDYFGDNDMMINYIVDDMDAIVERLHKEGVKFVDEVTGYEGLGKFVHIEDNEGRRVELWEPVK